MIEIQINNGDRHAVEKIGSDLMINEEKSSVEVVKLNQTSYKVFSKSKIFTVQIREKKDDQLTLSINGKITSLTSKRHVDQILEKLGMNAGSSSSISDVKAPMPGTILSLNVDVGDQVSKGDSILILEAMKMENVIKSPGDGVVNSILVNQGDNVEKNQLLISLE